MKKLIVLLGLTLIVAEPVALAQLGQNLTGAVDNYASSLQAKMRFPAARIPVKVYIEDGSKVPGFRPDFVSLIKESFALWEASLIVKNPI
jgi:hypothetical protein